MALLALSVGVLGVYVVRLQGDVRQLSRAAGRTAESRKQDTPPPGASAGTDEALSGRVASLEKELEATNGRLALLYARQQLAGATAEASAHTKERVLSIVADEADRILGKQLLWHRNNFLSARAPGFQAFAHGAQLTQTQSEAVWGQLEAEADEFVDLLRVPELREDPDALIREIRAALEATDDRVRRILNAEQMKLYVHGRAMERAAIMPWLNAPPGQ